MQTMNSRHSFAVNVTMIPALRSAAMVLGLVGLLSAGTSATAVTFSFASGDRSAQAMFQSSLADNSLVVRLANTSPVDVKEPVYVLTAVFFDLAGNPALTKASAVLANGVEVYFGGAPAGGVVGGEWAYRGALAGAPGSAGLGISSTGLGLFGPGDRFPGDDLDPPDSPSGLNYGLTSAGDDPTTGNWPVTGKDPLIHGEVVFTLDGLPSGFDVFTGISNVWFQYGTGLDEPSFEGDGDDGVGGNYIPEPLTIFCMLGSLGAVGAHVRNRFLTL